MAFKFSPGDKVVLAFPIGSGWTSRRALQKGTRGVVKTVKNDVDHSVIVCCDFPGIAGGWWVYEDELDLADASITVDTSLLL